MYLEIMTWPEAAFDNDGVRGPLADLERLAGLVEANLATAQPGSVIRIQDEFARNSPYALVLSIRNDGFDPAAEDSILSSI